jgi:serine/threonine protein kinase
MSWLSDEAISRLQAASVLPDVSGTRYRLVERIGSGGMGAVYLAEDSILARRVALKVLDLPDAPSELAARLLREAHILARLEHPGIVPVHDAGTLADGRVFYAMKFVEGRRLDRVAEEMTSLPDRLRIFQRICDAVAFAHARGVLHRDLKPENIMVGPFGEVLVMDWGVAKILESRENDPEARNPESLASLAEVFPVQPAKTAHGTVLGTPGYMAPEQARGDVESLDARADIFSLGALMQFLLEPRPQQGTTTLDKGANALAMASSSFWGILFVPRPLAAIARKAMSEDREGRYTSTSELALDIARYLDGLPVSAYPENIFRKVARLAGRYRVAIALVLTYLVVRAMLFFFFRR